MANSARSLVSLYPMWAAVCGAAACKDSSSADADHSSESEESAGDGDGDGDPKLDMPPGPDGCIVHVNQATGNDQTSA